MLSPARFDWRAEADTAMSSRDEEDGGSAGVVYL